ncbi:hypothetical protein CRM22_001735 [Opisthorchis felineus]|uniref:Uncharacterized protein n=1 Tax=Opisthorchis felineus TaxID=147828 RepID=A0A4S2M996_OPIFE|nr:hypothetical protein CRM22_001735 [Opisthorchis felineus]
MTPVTLHISDDCYSINDHCAERFCLRSPHTAFPKQSAGLPHLPTVYGYIAFILVSVNTGSTGTAFLVSTSRSLTVGGFELHSFINCFPIWPPGPVSSQLLRVCSSPYVPFHFDRHLACKVSYRILFVLHSNQFASSCAFLRVHSHTPIMSHLCLVSLFFVVCRLYSFDLQKYHQHSLLF